jgi:hypothetical protein
MKNRVVTSATPTPEGGRRSAIEDSQDEELVHLLTEWDAPVLDEVRVRGIVRHLENDASQSFGSFWPLPFSLAGVALAAGGALGFIAPIPAASPRLVDLVAWLW